MIEKICVMEGCNSFASNKIKNFESFFSNQKQGIHLVTYNLCELHNRTREGVVSLKKLKMDNPHLKHIL